MEKLVINKSIGISKRPSEVWEILTDPKMSKNWITGFDPDLGKLESDWKIGSPVTWKFKNGSLCVWGNVIELNKDKILSYTTIDENTADLELGEECFMRFELESKDESTILHVEHGDFTNIPDGQDLYESNLEAWERILKKIKAIAEESTRLPDNSFDIDPDNPKVITRRRFNAPIGFVWRIWTDPDLIPEWWGPVEMKTDVDKMIMQKNGSWRFIQRGKDGKEHAFKGIYKKILPPKEIIQTFEYEGMPGKIMTETITFEESGGKTFMTDTSLFGSMEDRENMLEAGMKEGITETMDRFQELLEKQAKKLDIITEGGMRKIIISEFMTLDGVIEDPGGSEKTEFGGWTWQFHNDEIEQVKFEELFSADTLLLGRVTYEGFAAAWPGLTDEQGFAERMNSLPKYVVSRTLNDANWNNSHIIKDEIIENIRKLKEEPGMDILIMGSATLVNTLIKNDLVDVVNLLVYPVVLGKGKKLFKENSMKLKLIETKTFAKGVVLLRYETDRG